MTHEELPAAPGHPFYRHLNELLDREKFDEFAEKECAQFYADKNGRPSLTTGTYFRLLLKRKPNSLDPGSANQEGDSPRNQAFLRSSLDLGSSVTLDASVYFVDRLPNQHLPRRAGSDARLAWQVSPKAELAVVGQSLLGPDHPEFGQPNTRRDFERSVFGKVSCAF